MSRCKHIIDTVGLPTRGERCDNRVRTIADRNGESKRMKLAEGYVSHPYTHMYESVKCESGLCEFHYNIRYYKRLGHGRES